jgi:hypothetical protein
MSTIETDVRPHGRTQACDGCGAILTGGRYCSECGCAATVAVPTNGHPLGFAHAAIPRRGRGRMLAGGAAALGVIGVAAAGTAVLTSGNDVQSAHAAFQQKVAGTFAPLRKTNGALSAELARIHGAKPTDARVAVRNAQQTATAAQGALGALNVPADSEPLARGAREALDRETGYLAAVSAVLSNQSSATRGQLETLSSNLASALSAAGPAVAGTGSTVSGADVLTAWAQRTARVLKQRADSKAARRRARAQQSGTSAATTASTTTATNPYANGRDCGAGVFAGPDTSCDFAFNVRSAYLEAPGLTASVTVYSPTTGQTYAMECAPSGSGTTCSGANNASVTF